MTGWGTGVGKGIGTGRMGKQEDGAGETWTTRTDWRTMMTHQPF